MQLRWTKGRALFGLARLLLAGTKFFDFFFEAMDLIPSNVAVAGSWRSVDLEHKLALEGWGLSSTEKKGWGWE